MTMVGFELPTTKTTSGAMAILPENYYIFIMSALSPSSLLPLTPEWDSRSSLTALGPALTQLDF